MYLGPPFLLSRRHRRIIIFIFLPSVAFRSLPQPSLVKVPIGGFGGFLAVPPARPGLAWSRMTV
jgi:hypothetical protein